MSADTVRLIRPRTYEETVTAVQRCGARGGIARGLGRAPGDAARNAGGAVLDMTGLDRIHAVDADDGTVLCDAGVPLHRLAEALLPLGWFPPVLPGTRSTTVGGAIGADVHGRNHPVAGSFARHVLALELLTADGRIVSALPGTDLFDATTGGLGLTGVILTATLRLQPVETALMSVDTERATDLDDLLTRMTATGHPYTSARIDPLARGAATGRAVLTRADHAPPTALRGGTRAWRDALAPGAALRTRPRLPAGLLGRHAMSLRNELWYRAAPRARTGRLQRVPAFFHPGDGARVPAFFHPGDGARVPAFFRPGDGARGGAVRYQFALPYGEEETLRRIVRWVSGRRCPSFPAVLTRFGEADPGWLSFPVPGWGLALDLPPGLPGLAAFLDALDEEVARAGGRVCLAKDARLRPDLLAAMYPRLADFRALRAELDPRALFTSDLSRRLGL
ncbi:FAD-binding protein [Streptomyces sp. NPDC057877]|uniref:FAD-dependent oxidoreductase n=1 Tax=Streptomyces sp. NPDC057877 TaxID=3346269 RepID=UPI00367937BA